MKKKVGSRTPVVVVVVGNQSVLSCLKKSIRYIQTGHLEKFPLREFPGWEVTSILGLASQRARVMLRTPVYTYVLVYRVSSFLPGAFPTIVLTAKQLAYCLVLSVRFRDTSMYDGLRGHV